MAKKTKVSVGKVIPVQQLEEGENLLSLDSKIRLDRETKTKLRLSRKHESKINKEIRLASKILLEIELGK